MYHTAHNTDMTVHLSNNTKRYLFTAMPMLHSSTGEQMIISHEIAIFVVYGQFVISKVVYQI